MPDINTYLQQIESATYGRDVRSAIHDGIELCYSDVETAQDAAAASAAAAAGSLTNLAPAFSDATAYAVGDYVIYNGVLYKFITAHAAGAWTGSDAETATFAGETGAIKSAIDNLQNDVVVEKVDGEWVQNRAMISGGVLAEVTASNFCHSGFLRVGKDATISILSGYKIYAWKGAYSEFGHPAAGITEAWTDGNFSYSYDAVNPYLIICVMKSNSAAITPTEAENAITVSVESQTVFALKTDMTAAQYAISETETRVTNAEDAIETAADRIFPALAPSIGVAKSTLSDDTMWAKYQDAGLSAVRFSARWEEIETEQGTYTWSELDQKVAYAEANNLQMLIILVSRSANTIYGTTKAPLTTEQKVGWANFTSALFQRYKNKGIIYEVWNEPYLSSNWEGTAYDYAYLANTTSQRLRTIAGGGKIATGCLHIDAGDFTGQITSEEMIANNCVRYADYLSIHVYKTTAPIVAIKQSYIFFKKLLGMYGYGDTPIIISEIGYANSHESIAKDVPDALKLAYIPQIALVARYVFNIPYTFIYTDVTAEANKSLAEYWYGIFGSDGSDTDYTTALANMVSQLQNLEFIGYKRVCSVNHALAFRKTDGTYIIFYWNTGATFSAASGGGYTVTYNNLFGWLNGQNVVFTPTIKSMSAEEIDVNEFDDNIGQLIADSEESQDIQVARLGTTKITETQLQQLLALLS